MATEGSKAKLIARAGWIGRLVRAMGRLYATALALALGALWAFTELADEVLEREVGAFNRQVLLGVDALTSPAWTPYGLAVTQLGSVTGIVVVGATATLALFRLRAFLDAATLVVVLAGAGLLTYALKLLFAQTRPDVFPPVVLESSYSFPSGHTLLSFSLYGFLAARLVLRSPGVRWRWLAAAGLVTLAMLIAGSRVYLGVHWPTDIAAGVLVAIFWLSACLLGRGFFARRRRS